MLLGYGFAVGLVGLGLRWFVYVCPYVCLPFGWFFANASPVVGSVTGSAVHISYINYRCGCSLDRYPVCYAFTVLLPTGGCFLLPH